MDINLRNREYRKLHDTEIGQLLHQGCSSNDWSQIEVSDDFIPDNIFNSTLTGNIRLNKFDGELNLLGGIPVKAGIYNSWLHNCEVGRNVLIHSVRGYIANYLIDEGAVVHNVTTIAADGESTFGNGIPIETINEEGGREVPIYDHLSSQLAYIIALYRHRRGLIENLTRLIENYTRFVKSPLGRIGAYSRIVNCNTILNVKIGPAAIIDGAKKLKNGTINSNFEDPVKIGEGVIMEDFIVCSGARITDSTLVSRCFVGQGCVLDKHYSAVNSLFFANCQGFHGEACPIFAGPYTVTHHKSTLLIAGMFSFLNAGSGSNQSNHLYKLGPIHQGIMERGAKTTSDSYILWPSRVGAFSLVMGRHHQHSDTSNFPFSYLIENRDESYLVPGVNLRSIGIIRDSQKWPDRDRRRDSNLLDIINFNLLSPYTVQKMINGLEILKKLLQEGCDTSGLYTLQKMRIEKHALERGIKLYEMAIWKFLGNSLISRLEGQSYLKKKSVKELSGCLYIEDIPGIGTWVDIAGMICPFEALDTILKSIESGEADSLDEINASLRLLHKNYYRYEWNWAAAIIEKFYGKKPVDFDSTDVVNIVERWLESVTGIDNLLLEDAKKEFTMSKMIGFGIDGCEMIKELDFASVRGEFESNYVVKTIYEHIEEKKKLGKRVIDAVSTTGVLTSND